MNTPGLFAAGDSGGPGNGPGSLVLLTRPECSLCEQMHTALRVLQARTPLPPIELVDVDSDPELQRRYGLKIPVLLLDGTVVCRTRLDEIALLAALKHPPIGAARRS